MSNPICALCDQEIVDERPLYIFGEPMHGQCDLTVVPDVCDNDKCFYWRWQHAGACVV